MNLPVLIQYLYGTVTLTGLYSFEFVDKNRNTITEMFFLTPPKSKSVTESTRSTTQPTLAGNYNTDAGNATKNITLAGELYFPYVGSPDNPVARDNSGLENTLTGLEEFLKIRYYLIRYRDYTMTPNAKMLVPTNLMSVSKEITTLYKKISKKVKEKTGALYDEIGVIFHDYDMDDHWHCRIDNFTSKQSDNKYIAIEYNISIECYRPDYGKNSPPKSEQTKRTTNESLDILNIQLQNIGYEDAYDQIQAEIGYNYAFANAAIAVNTMIDNINTENTAIQGGQSTASTLMPTYISSLLTNVNFAMNSFLETFFSVSQQSLYDTGDISIDDVVGRDLTIFYNAMQKVKIQAESIKGVLNSIVKVEELRYYSNADDYTLTEEQFDSDDSNKVENTTNFYYYTILSGDTARIIAQRELNNQANFTKILQINDITENDFIDETLVGQKIKIPFPITVTARGEDNLVYEADFSNSENFLFGKDIYTGINKELRVSETGDLLSTDGIDNAYQNVENRLNNSKGSLNVFSPDWGTIPIDDGNTPFLVKIDRYLTDVVSQIQADPRVESVQMDLEKLEFKGESITVPTKIFFIGTEETREAII